MRRVMVAVNDPKRDRALLELALALGVEGDVVAIAVLEVPAEKPLSAAQGAAQRRRRQLEKVARASDTGSVRPRVNVKVARRTWDAYVEAVEHERIDLLLLPWRRGLDLGRSLDEILRQPAPCDLAVVRADDISQARRILVPVRVPVRGYAQLAIAIASALADRSDGTVTLLHATEPGQEAPRTRGTLYDALADEQYPRVTQLITAVGPPAEVIAAELREHDLVVVGATAREDARSSFGPVGDVVARTRKPMVVVRMRAPIASRIFAARAAMPAARHERSAYISELVDKWFAENSFSSTEFADLGRLVDLKRQQRLTISVGLPALNEEQTIGQVVRRLRSRLMDEYPLVDEIVVIDSSSTDRTREIAAKAGVPVYVHQEVLPEMGQYAGKGEALWKSLYVLRGDIICWVDTDIRNIHPKFVYGIVGPLLTRPSLHYVKAFYQRPLALGAELQATGGGRVTELTARPILNLFFPELSGMVQPLAGEYGGRRALLEQLPFFTGYGVETGLLIDILQRTGLSAIAQTDMKQRIHRNQSLLDLSKMAFAVLQVALKRVGEAAGRPIWEEANASLKLITGGERGRYRLDVKEIEEIERPPMLSLPQYQAARAALARESA